MGFVEDGLVFGTESRQFIDVEKATVINVIGRNSPLGEAVRLCLDKFVQQIKGAWVFRLAVNTLDIFAHELASLLGPRAQSRNSPLLDFLLAIAFRALFRRRTTTIREMIESRDNALQFQEVLVRFAQLVLQTVDIIGEDARILPWIDREAVLEIEDAELTSLPIECEL